jgi:hypothetical protein
MAQRLPPLVTCPRVTAGTPEATEPPPGPERSQVRRQVIPKAARAALCPKSKFGWTKPSINVKLTGVSCQFRHTHARPLPQRNLLPRLVRGGCSADKQIFSSSRMLDGKLQKYKNNYKFFEILVRFHFKGTARP